MPKAGGPAVELHPLSEEQLEAFWDSARERNERLANVLLVAGWTGLRWSELRALRVRDFVEVPAAAARRPAPRHLRVSTSR